MPAQFSLLLAGALLIGLPHPISSDENLSQDRQAPSSLEVFSAVAGRVVGAASLCDQISAERVSAATQKAAMIASLQAADDQESASARNLFANGAVVGMDALKSGQADCNIVAASLTSLERVERKMPGAPGEMDE